MTLCLPNGRKIPERPSFLLDCSLLGGITTVAWLYENGGCVGCQLQFADGSYHTYDTRGRQIQQSAHFANRYIKYYTVWKCRDLLCHSLLTISYSGGVCRRFGFSYFASDNPYSRNQLCRYWLWNCSKRCLNGSETVDVSFSWKFALLRFKHALRLRARRRIARIISETRGICDDVSALMAAYVV